MGQGDSAFVSCGDDTLLIDAGVSSEGETVVDYLRSLGVTELDYVVCTHAHEDHCGGLAAVLAGTETDAFYCSVDSWHTKAFSDVVKYADEQGVCVTIDGELFSVKPETAKEFFEKEVLTRL